jgi:hypothetical protein
LRIIQAQIIDNELPRIMRGEQHPLFWKDICRLQEEKGNLFLELFGVSNFKIYAMKAFYAFANAAEEMQFCFYYQPKTEKSLREKATERRKDNILNRREVFEGPPTEDWRSCGAITGFNEKNGSIMIKDRSETVRAKYCNVCFRDHYAKGDLPGTPCRKTVNCPGSIVFGQSFATKMLIVNNIQNVVRKGKSIKQQDGVQEVESLNNQEIDFSPFLKRAAGAFGALDQAVKDRSTGHWQKMVDQRKNLHAPDEPEMPEIGGEQQPAIASWKSVFRFATNFEDKPEDKKKIVSLNEMTEEDKAKIEEYWDYLDPDYAKALVKDY